MLWNERRSAEKLNASIAKLTSAFNGGLRASGEARK